MPYIIDNMIAEGKCDPFIVVMNDGMVRYPTTPEGPFSDTAMEDNLVGSCIPYIEANYPAKTDKWSRAIAGLSMGSGQCATTAYHHPDMFGYIGMFSGKCGIDKEKTPDLYEYAKDTENFGKQYRVYFRGMGDCDESSMFTNFPIDDALLAETGVDKIPGYHRVTYPDQTHEYGAWRRMLYDFAQLIFK
jgi:enterochelin esterase family protein